MCVAKEVIGLVGGVASEAFKTTANYINLKNNNDYRVQVAISNAKNAQALAKNEQQIGIQKSRMEKISKLKEANALQANQAASNMQIDSYNSNLAYQDILNEGEINSNNILNEYDLNARNYYKQANNYLGQISAYNSQFKNSLIPLGFNGLGQMGKVASEWFEEIQTGGEDGSI